MGDQDSGSLIVAPLEGGLLMKCLADHSGYEFLIQGNSLNYG